MRARTMLANLLYIWTHYKIVRVIWPRHKADILWVKITTVSKIICTVSIFASWCYAIFFDRPEYFADGVYSIQFWHISRFIFSNAEYCHRPRKDCNGRDIRYLRVSGLRECKKACSADCRCKSIQSHGSTCWMKHYACTDAQLINSRVGHDYVRKGKVLKKLSFRQVIICLHYARHCKYNCRIISPENVASSLFRLTPSSTQFSTPTFFRARRKLCCETCYMRRKELQWVSTM